MSEAWLRGATALLAAALTACSGDYVIGALPGAPNGGLDLDGGTNQSGGLTFIVRDFKVFDAADPTTNPDFENAPKTDQNGNPNATYIGPWDDRNIVLPDLGTDGTPVYQTTTLATLTTHGKASFDQWFHDTPGTNVRIEIPLMPTQNPDGTYGYDSQVSGIALSPTEPAKQFFPIDDGGPNPSPFGNQGQPHNYSFTCEIHTTFRYEGGESLHYRGDDDVWVFINRKRVIDLGGIHDPETADIQLDSLGLVKGSEYPLDFFFAERHRRGSNVLFTTSFALHSVSQ
jgi:fibro-slime domain-containing protein